jgi:hypothetical protein
MRIVILAAALSCVACFPKTSSRNFATDPFSPAVGRVRARVGNRLR